MGSYGYAYAHRFLDYSATNTTMGRPILRFVYGVRGRRTTCVTLKQIEKYFRSTPPEHTRKTVDELIGKGLLLMLRTGMNRKRTGYYYDLTKQGYTHLYGGTYWDTPEGRQQHIEHWD